MNEDRDGDEQAAFVGCPHETHGCTTAVRISTIDVRMLRSHTKLAVVDFIGGTTLRVYAIEDYRHANRNRSHGSRCGDFDHSRCRWASTCPQGWRAVKGSQQQRDGGLTLIRDRRPRPRAPFGVNRPTLMRGELTPIVGASRIRDIADALTQEEGNWREAPGGRFGKEPKMRPLVSDWVGRAVPWCQTLGGS